jgi:OFA family oxalate/formate antiporter-like MFS transporter
MVAVACNSIAALLAVFVIKPMRRAHIERSNEMAASGVSTPAALSVRNASA